MKVYLNTTKKVNYSNNLNRYNNTNSPYSNFLQNNDRFELSSKTNSNLSFKATFWKHLSAGISAGAASGAAIGTKVGGVVDLGSAGMSLGVPTATGATVGGFLGGVTGAIGGTVSYFTCKSREEIKKAAAEEAAKIKKERDDLEAKAKALEEQQNSADAKNKEAFDKQQGQLEKLKEHNRILEKYAVKKYEEANGVGLGRIAGYYEDKNLLNAAFISPYKKSFDPETKFESYNVPNGVLLYGTSGNGKTTLAEGIIEELMNTTDTEYYNLSDLKRSKLEDKLCEIKEKAQQDWENNNKRTIIFLDEFDGFAPSPSIIKRKLQGDDTENPSNGYLKNFMNDCSKFGITIIATTNYPRNIEKPFIDNDSRFTVRTAIEPPKAEDITQILNYYLDGLTDNTVNLEEVTDVLVQKMDRDKAMYSSSKIEKLAEKAKDKAKKEKRFVSQEDLLKIASKTNPNIDSDDIDSFKEDFEFITNMTYEEYLEEKEELKQQEDTEE